MNDINAENKGDAKPAFFYGYALHFAHGCNRFDVEQPPYPTFFNLFSDV